MPSIRQLVQRQALQMKAGLRVGEQMRRWATWICQKLFTVRRRVEVTVQLGRRSEDAEVDSASRGVYQPRLPQQA